MNNAPLQPNGNMVGILAAVAASAPTPIQLPAYGTTGAPGAQVECVNVATQTVFLVYASDSATCATRAAAGIPANGAPGAPGLIPLIQGSAKPYTIPAGSWISAIVAATTGQIYVIPGDGF